MKTIELTKGCVTVISDADTALAAKYNWQAHRGTNRFYAATTVKQPDGTRKTVFLHRLINKTPDGYETDHINGDSLDNRRSNLRTTTKSQNQHNSKKRTDNTSGYKGVSWHKASNKWRTRVHRAGASVYTGYFANVTDAAKAYNNKAKELLGEYARLNIIKENNNGS